jgi:minor extracellular serine protease Vpr
MNGRWWGGTNGPVHGPGTAVPIRETDVLRIEIFDARGRQMHRAVDEQYLPRNDSAMGFFAFAFDGTTRNGNRTNVVPNGTYTMRLSVLKALGDDNNPAHWESWTSPQFVIARP